MVPHTTHGPGHLLWAVTSTFLILQERPGDLLLDKKNGIMFLGLKHFTSIPSILSACAKSIHLCMFVAFFVSPYPLLKIPTCTGIEIFLTLLCLRPLSNRKYGALSVRWVRKSEKEKWSAGHPTPQDWQWCVLPGSRNLSSNLVNRKSRQTNWTKFISQMINRVFIQLC